MGLSDLDDRVLPSAAQRVQQVRDAVASAPGPAQALRGLDDRYAGAGALRVVRDAPVLGALVAVAVLLAGTGTGVALSWAPAQAQGGAAPVVLGPAPGVDADTAVAQASAAAVQRSRTTPGTRALALVSLREQLTVARTVGLLAESTLQVRRALLRAPVAGAPELLTVEVADDPARTLRALYAATAQRKAQDVRELTRSTGRAPTGQGVGAGPDPAAATAADTAAAEAAAYANDCACVLALLLEGTVAELAELPALRVVRGVELAPRGARAETVELRPLAPGVTGPVP